MYAGGCWLCAVRANRGTGGRHSRPKGVAVTSRRGLVRSKKGPIPVGTHTYPGKMAREIRAARSKGRMEFTCMIDIRDYDTLDAVAKSLQLARVKETGAPFEPEVKERRAIRAAKSHEIANARRDEILETARIARAIEPAHE